MSCKCSLFVSLARIKWVRFTCAWRTVNELNYLKNNHFFPIIFSLFSSTSVCIRICFWGTCSFWRRDCSMLFSALLPNMTAVLTTGTDVKGWIIDDLSVLHSLKCFILVHAFSVIPTCYESSDNIDLSNFLSLFCHCTGISIP